MSERPMRKRNVISRGRTGCLTCRRRRLKCDEGKPACYSCMRLNLKCEGYAQRISFKDQTESVVERAQGKRSKKTMTTNLSTDTSDTSSPPEATAPSSVLDSQDIPKITPLQSPSSLRAQGPPNGINAVSPYSSSIPQKVETATALTSGWPSDDACSSEVAGNTSRDEKTIVGPPPIEQDPVLTLSKPPSNAVLSLCGAYEFPEDNLYFEYSAGSRFQSLLRILPLPELLRSESVSPHVYNAALALAAQHLSTSGSSPTNPAIIRRHAFQHSLKALQGVRDDLFGSEKSGTLTRTHNIHGAISLFATILLLANFELQRSALLSWHIHMRGAASCLNVWHHEMRKRPAGVLLIRTFSRMALLLRIYNKDYSVTSPQIMDASLAIWVQQLLMDSEQSQDQLLLLVERITHWEINARQEPEQEHVWTKQSYDILADLAQWRNNLTVSELPSKRKSNEAGVIISTTPDSSTASRLTRVSALYFSQSNDPCSAAVNYATYLCTQMRARTRYTKKDGCILPPDADDRALTICRIAAGFSPAQFGNAFTYGYGMLPSVVGAYRWSSNSGLKAWIKGWLARYPTSREGIWSVTQTLRLLATMDGQHATRDQWWFVAVQIIDEAHDPSPGLEDAESKTFRVVLRGRTTDGSSEDHLVIPI